MPYSGHPGLQNLYTSDPLTGSVELFHKNLEGLSMWNVSWDGKTIAGIRGLPDGGRQLLSIKSGKARSLMECAAGESLNLFGFNSDNSEVYVLTNQGQEVEYARLESINLDTADRTILAEDAESKVDLSEPVFDRTGKHLIAAAYFRDRLVYRWYSQEAESLFASISKSLPDGDIKLKECSKDGKKWLVNVIRDTEPDAEYYFNAENNRLVQLDSRRNAVPSEKLGRMRPVRYKARDGCEISGYLTVPVGFPEANLPLVVFPHGGPNKRNFWGYDARVQFIASRGYAVFQPNFRGSSGYGKGFMNAGNKQWGRGVMQDDISDGVNWLVSIGIVDVRRVAIVGGSYGGYAALAGLAFTPDMYAAGACLFGPSDLSAFVREVPATWRHFQGDLSVMIGDPDLPEDAKRLAWQSPIHSTEKIKVPVMLYHGEEDEIVLKSQTDRFVTACRSSGVNVDYLISMDEGHGFLDPINEQAVYVAIERFLAKHIGGKQQVDVPQEVERRLVILRKSASVE
jgi:dipeptidyl aminopeptidase/acylaminoacyl peptidase